MNVEPVTKVEKLFEWIDEMALAIQKHKDITYLEALAETGENLLDLEIKQSLPFEEKKKLEQQLKEEIPKEVQKEDVRKSFQLAVIKGMKEAVQPHHAMTPDAVALFIGYLAQKLTAQKDTLTVLDPAVGSANLLSAVLNQLSQTVVGYGVEVDETLLHIAYVLSELQEHHVELFHQDSIEELAVPPVDVVVSDLPIGYYPKDDVAESFQLKAETNRSYVHYLMIEKTLQHVKDGGFLLLLIPNTMFEMDGNDRLQKYIKEHAFTLGLLQLPASMFTSEQFGKSIWMLQKKGEGVKQPNQALLAELPSFSRYEALLDMTKQIDKWLKDQGFAK